MSGTETAVRENKKMRTRDFIYAGAFAALYVVVMLVVVMGLGAVAVPLYLVTPFIMGIVGATIYLLYTLKVHKFGAVLILGILFTLCTGSYNWAAILVCVLATIFAELILLAGKYKSRKMYMLSYPVFNLTMAGPFAMLYVARDQFLSISMSYYGPERTAKMEALTPVWMWYAQMGLAVLGGAIGVIIASKLVKKHFEKAGIV